MNEQWFWEQCGGIHVDYSDKDGCPAHYKMPDGVCFLDTDKPDLNHLFKYAVPKLSNLGYCVSVVYRDDEAVADVVTNDNEEITKTIAFDKDPALALFRAIYEAFGGK